MGMASGFLFTWFFDLRDGIMKNTPGHLQVLMAIVSLSFLSCLNDETEIALREAGDNRHELEDVIFHYRFEDPDMEKLKAARFLIANMPAHYSYVGKDMEEYQDSVLSILKKDLSPEQQHDMVDRLYHDDYSLRNIPMVSDILIMKAEYLIDNIDMAFEQWRNRAWGRHISFDDFCEYILPYKAQEMQSMDNWRQVFSQKYSDSICTVPPEDFQRNSLYGAIDIVRDEINRKNVPHVLWGGQSSPSLLSARTMSSMTFGTCQDYVTMGTLVFRSLGMASAVDRIPLWGRNHEGHSWFVFPGDKGRMIPTVNSLILGAGIAFYPYERIPKVFRSSYAINRDCLKYFNTAEYVYPFDMCCKDVTDEYCRAHDISVPLIGGLELKDRYAYIAMAENDGMPVWRVLDFGPVERGMARFRKMGPDMLYLVLGFDGQGLIPASNPFILNADGSMVEIKPYDGKNIGEKVRIRLRRKYYESYNVVDMRSRLLGGEIQYSDYSDFSNAVTVYRTDSVSTAVSVSDKGWGEHRFWRYASAPGTWGSLSELEFIGADGKRIAGGVPVCCKQADAMTAARAFDNDLLSNFETEEPDCAWVGMDMGYPVGLSEVRVYPRGDDNDISPGLPYELYAWNGRIWELLETFVAEEPYYDADVATDVLLWLRCPHRGMNERPFIIDSKKNITWW